MSVMEDSPAPGVLRLRLNRPEVRNALNLEMRTFLAKRLTQADRDEQTRVVILAGSEEAFAAGADLKQIQGLGPVGMHKLGYHRLWQAIADFQKPLVAAVRGFALGGGFELVLHADLVVAGRSATFGLPEIKVGIMPGAGGTQRLVRIVGKHRAMRLLTSGEFIKAPMAEEWGLISHLVEDSEVEERAVDLSAKMAKGPALALEYIKETVIVGADLPLAAGLALERKSLHLLFDSPDKEEGILAFTQSRRPSFL